MIKSKFRHIYSEHIARNTARENRHKQGEYVALGLAVSIAV
jgi:hypothetical protein